MIDLIKLSEWVNQWKMSFNPNITKQAQEVIFSRKSKKTDHSTVYLNDASVEHANCLNFLQHIKEKTSKTNRGIGVMQKLKHLLPRHSLIIICK